MITLEERIRIKTTPEAFMTFWAHLDQNYPFMHPRDHLWVKCIKGRPDEVGCVWENREYIGGRHLVNEQYRVVEVIPNKRIVSRLATFPRSLLRTELILEISALEHEIEVTETTHIGYDVPILGRIVDAIVNKRLEPILAAVKAHEAEGLQYIRDYLEKSAKRSLSEEALEDAGPTRPS
jgi:hypothetical protein